MFADSVIEPEHPVTVPAGVTLAVGKGFTFTVTELVLVHPVATIVSVNE